MKEEDGKKGKLYIHHYTYARLNTGYVSIVICVATQFSPSSICSSHPYIFFNQDRTTVTFMGFKVTQGGNLIDPRNGHMLEAGIVSQKLYDDLKLNRVNFDEDFLSWPKHVMIEKIATVMGMDFPYDPDESYVLTVDNVIKILAIHMRIR